MYLVATAVCPASVLILRRRALPLVVTVVFHFSFFTLFFRFHTHTQPTMSYYGSNSGTSYGGGGYGGSSSYGGGGSGSYGGGATYPPSGDAMGNLGRGLTSVDFASQQLIPFEKNFYIEHPAVTARPESEAQAWRASKQIVITGSDVPKPCLTFEEASMPEYVLSEVLKCGFDKPTPIQSQGWPMALKGKNMVGVSATGSGKTLAFLLPGMIHINAQVS